MAESTSRTCDTVKNSTEASAHQHKAEKTEECQSKKCLLNMVEMVVLAVVLAIAGGLLALPSVFYFIRMDVEVCNTYI